MIKLLLTEEKAEQLVQLLDVALKSGGLQVAKVVVNLTDDIMAAVQESKESLSDPSPLSNNE